MLISINDEYDVSFESTYTVIPSLDDCYEFEIVVTDDEGTYQTLYIWRIETGFCMNIESSIDEDLGGGWSYLQLKA